MEDKVPSLRCVLRLSDKPHEDMLTMSHCHVDFLKLYINFSDFEMQFIASFLGRFPNLKFLSIHQSSWNDCIHLPQSNVSDLYWASQNLAFIDHLKILEISLCPGDNALALMKYLTKNGKNLVYLVIRYSSRFWEMSELGRVIDDIRKEKASFELRFYSQAEPNPPKFEEVNEHHRKYALMLTEKEKGEIYEQKILRRYPEFQEFGLPLWYTAEFMDESLNCWMPPAFRDGPGLDESMDFCSDF
ncbi:hypothetical protein AQUCO_27600001v1 [Aquilegia coerulea]|uniref:FBD domain-containing protein n=1 Tax=Aquilegia coerulea TaxID=218851 RepID=A0A2G5C1W8_AQUCA|nr:hypothetical protein AQUCO_27600001v1 [Aquilegia coerulea]